MIERQRETGRSVRGTGLEDPDEIKRVLPAMRDLRGRARATNLGRAAQLDSALERAADGRLDEAGRAQALAVAHQLIGSAGTFGFAEASRRALELKEFFALPQFDDDDVQTARIRLLALRSDLQNDSDDFEF
jgi:hypothetical protein